MTSDRSASLSSSPILFASQRSLAVLVSPTILGPDFIFNFTVLSSPPAPILPFKSIPESSARFFFPATIYFHLQGQRPIFAIVHQDRFNYSFVDTDPGFSAYELGHQNFVTSSRAPEGVLNLYVNFLFSLVCVWFRLCSRTRYWSRVKSIISCTH